VPERSYTSVSWVDKDAAGHPVDAERLGKLDTGISNAQTTANEAIKASEEPPAFVKEHSYIAGFQIKHAEQLWAAKVGFTSGTSFNATNWNLLGNTGVSTVNGKTGAVTLAASDVSAVSTTEKGAHSGVAELNSSGKVPESQLPETSSPVSSVNTKTGAVVLAASDVGAIPSAQKGAASGVPTLNSSSHIPLVEMDPSVVVAQTVAQVTTSGNYKPDLKEGQRIFHVKTSGELNIQAPINVPSGSGTIYIEIEVEGKEAITHSLVSSWLYGGAPTPNLKEITSINRYQYLSDNRTTWKGIGEESVPAGTVVILSPGEETIPEYKEGKWTAVAKSSVGVPKGEVESLAVAAVSSGASLGSVRVGTGTNSTAWESLLAVTQGQVIISEPITNTRVLGGIVRTTKITSGSKNAVVGSSAALLGVTVEGGGIPSATTVIGTSGEGIELSHAATESKTGPLTYGTINAFYPITVAGITATMPSLDQVVVVSNRSGGEIKLKGRFTQYISTTLTATSKEAVVTSSANLLVGMFVYCLGIPGLTTIAKIIDATHIELSAEATESKTVIAEYEPISASTEITIALTHEETITYYQHRGFWRAFADHRSVTALETIIKSVSVESLFTALTLNTPTVKQAEGIASWPAGFRLENAGTVVRLRGVVQISAAEEVKTTNALVTIPGTAFRPVGSEAWIRTATVGERMVILKVLENGQIRPVGTALKAGEQIILDGSTFTIIA
jgi:hypothetical protein